MISGPYPNVLQTRVPKVEILVVQKFDYQVLHRVAILEKKIFVKRLNKLTGPYSTDVHCFKARVEKLLEI